MNLILFFAGFTALAALIPIIYLVFHALTIEVEDETSVLILKFGRLETVLKKPGLKLFPQKMLPWYKVFAISQQRDYYNYRNIHINDNNGTSLIVDLWIEYQVVDPTKASFEVEDWQQALRNLVLHAATAVLCTKDLNQILTSRNEISELLFKDVANETARWGIEVKNVLLKNVALVPEVSRQMLATVAAKLERAQATIDEEGRLRIEQLHARTEREVAALVAEAKGQYPLHVGRAYKKLKSEPRVFKIYEELYGLSQVNPNRMVYFDGFEGHIRSLDAAMVATPLLGENNVTM